MKKLLICGDSFAADWTVKFQGCGWVNLLERDFKIKNLAQAGCSEYKIYKQLQSVNLNDYDLVLVSHTSPYRLYINKHPVYKKDILHKNSCLLYTDVLAHLEEYPELMPVAEYFNNYFDLEYAEFVHNLILEKIDKICVPKTLHLAHIEWTNLFKFKNFMNFNKIFEQHRGSINHYDTVGNDILYKKVLEKLREFI